MLLGLSTILKWIVTGKQGIFDIFKNFFIEKSFVKFTMILPVYENF